MLVLEPGLQQLVLVLEPGLVQELVLLVLLLELPVLLPVQKPFL
mgnify:CR=1 FL=1